jgi:hypothetical protein
MMAPARTRSLAWRVFWSVLAALYGYACLGSGLDRLSEASPALQQSVPAPFRANAEAALAAVTLTGGAGAQARDAARSAVLAAPVDRRAVALLGTQRLLANDYAGAEAAFRVGAQLGWREPLTQSYWYRAALQSGEPARAAERLDALLRVNPQMGGAEEMIEPLLASAHGRAALAERLAYRPGWLRRFLTPPGQTGADALARRAEVAGLMSAHGAGLTCAEIEPLARRLADAGMRQPARALRLQYCEAGQVAGLISDPEFAALSRGEGGGSGWSLHPSGDVSATLAGSGADAALLARNLAPVRRPILSQQVDLEAGAYRVVPATDPGDARGLLAASLACAGGRNYPDLGAPLMVTAGACSPQTLTLWLAPSPGEVSIRSVRLEPLR